MCGGWLYFVAAGTTLAAFAAVAYQKKEPPQRVGIPVRIYLLELLSHNLLQLSKSGGSNPLR